MTKNEWWSIRNEIRDAFDIHENLVRLHEDSSSAAAKRITDDAIEANLDRVEALMERVEEAMTFETELMARASD